MTKILSWWRRWWRIWTPATATRGERVAFIALMQGIGKGGLR